MERRSQNARILPCYRWLLGLLLGFSLSGVSLGAADQRSPIATHSSIDMALQGGRLTARIVAVPLPQLIEQVGKLTGARVRWLSPKEETRVSMEFTDAPLPQALRQILGRRNFLLFYTSTGEGAKLSRIWISGTHQGSRQAGQPVLALGGRVPRELSRTALHSRDPSARLDAIRQLKWYVQTDRRGVTSVLSWLARRDPNPLVRQTVIGELARMK